MDKLPNVENYSKCEVQPHKEEIDRSDVPFENLASNFVHLKVKRGSKIKNILDFALKKFALDEQRLMVCSSMGQGIAKAITCVEIIKRKIKGLHQINKICYKKIDEIWDPKNPEMDQLKVSRDIPSIHILLSKDQLDSNQPGYQAPGNYNDLLKQNVIEENNIRKRPKTFQKQRKIMKNIKTEEIKKETY